jgi:hypothetical protein
MPHILDAEAPDRTPTATDEFADDFGPRSLPEDEAAAEFEGEGGEHRGFVDDLGR